MLRRQKTILALLAESHRPVPRTVLVKLAFLLRRETVLRDDPAFYDFVPYRYGPFSFALYRELDGLHRDGFVTKADGQLALNTQMITTIRERISELAGTVRAAVSFVTRMYGRTARRDLVRDIYARYPWYATHSQLTNLKPMNLTIRQPAKPAVYTAGYQHKSVDDFFDDLLRAGIQVVIDVRANPVSRKYGFTRSFMCGIAEKLGMEYCHFPRLGIPRKERTGLGSEASYIHLLNTYESEVLPDLRTDVEELARMMKKKPSVLVCMEQDVRNCHRSRLAMAVSKVSGLPIHHIT